MRVLVACEFSGIVRDAFATRGHDAWSCDILPTESEQTKNECKHIQDSILNVFKAGEIASNFVSNSPCVKQTTIAVLFNKGEFWVGTNACDSPQIECPRKGLQTGVGYELCREVCKQKYHAEQDACIKAGENARGGVLYLIGHYYCCNNCIKTMQEYGIDRYYCIPQTWDLMIAHPPCTYLSYVGTRHWNDPGRLQKRLDALRFFANLWEAPINKICIENPKGCASPTITKYTQQIQPFYWGDSAYKTTWLWLKNLPKLVYQNDKTFFEDKTTCSPPKAIYILKTSGKRIHHTEAIHGGKERSRFWPGIANAMAEQWG